MGEGVAVVTATLVSDPNITVSCAVYVQDSTGDQSNWEFLPTAYHFSI